MERNVAPPRVFRPGKSVGPADTFSIDLPDKDNLYISDSEDSGSDDSGGDEPGPHCRSPSSSSAASSTETMAATPAGNAASALGNLLFPASTTGSQNRPSPVLDNSRLSFSVTWANTGDTTNASAAAATAAAAAAAAAAPTRASRTPREFLFKCPPAGELSKAARVAEFCHHPVLASFMYAALAVESYAGNKDSVSIESPSTASGNQDVSSSASSARTSVESSIRSSADGPAQERSSKPSEESSPQPTVPSSMDPLVGSLADETVGPTTKIADEKPSEGGSSEEKVEEESKPPRAGRGWRFATGLAGVAVGIAIGAAFVARRR